MNKNKTKNVEVETLLEQVKNLTEERDKLLFEAKENTIMSSMNDMKVKYEDVVKNSVPKDVFLEMSSDLSIYERLSSSMEMDFRVISQKIMKYNGECQCEDEEDIDDLNYLMEKVR